MTMSDVAERSDAAERRKSETRAWFEQLQDKIIAAFERLEEDAKGPSPRQEWRRDVS